MLKHTIDESPRRYHEIEFFIIIGQIWGHWLAGQGQGKNRIRAYAIIRLCRQGYEVSRYLNRETAKKFFQRYESDMVRVLINRGAKIPS